MAFIQVITHLVGHAANEMDLPDLPLATLAYTRLLQLKRNTHGDSEEMFRAIQNANPTPRRSAGSSSRRCGPSAGGPTGAQPPSDSDSQSGPKYAILGACGTRSSALRASSAPTSARG